MRTITKELAIDQWKKFVKTRTCPSCASTAWETKVLAFGTKAQHWRYNCKKCDEKWRKPVKYQGHEGL